VNNAMILREKAFAKVNLSLHILEREETGWHALQSIVAFAAVHDDLDLDLSRPPGLSVSGPFQAGLLEDNNLVLRAAQAVAAACPEFQGGHFHLIKRLPVAAGIGGGSADAAAALRLLARAQGLDVKSPPFPDIARRLGADVPVCLSPSLSFMEGRGERLTRLLQREPLFAVLVNPGIALATQAVFTELGLKPGERFTGTSHPLVSALVSDSEKTSLITLFHQSRNDLEASAIRLVPEIGAILRALRAQKACLGARMSGSGATVFGLFSDCRAAMQAARIIKGSFPKIWVRSTRLGLL
jgi:4-diphosphocytidyl-2-C-methyl-D-erythritol kinase